MHCVFLLKVVLFAVENKCTMNTVAYLTGCDIAGKFLEYFGLSPEVC
jgi:hypothetical protein